MQEFEDSDGKKIQKPFIFCHALLPFLSKVAENRGTSLKQLVHLIGGDNGKGFFKLISSMYNPDTIANPPAKKQRRNREQGICGAPMEETGQSMILLLAVVPRIPESPHNLRVIFEIVGINQIVFQICGDLCFLMPCYGLMPCSCSHPCLFCCSRRSKGKWTEQHTELRTYSSQATQLAGWQAKGSKYTTKWTQAFQSTVGPVLVRSLGEEDSTTFLAKTSMPTVHLLLVVNDILRPHMLRFFESEEELLELLRVQVGVVPHSYQGKDGAFEGPQCSKILDKATEILGPFLQCDEGLLFLNLLNSLKDVKKAVFGNVLSENWETVMATFAEDLVIAHNCVSLPITPKLHILQHHVVQKVTLIERALGRENEKALEAVHGSFSKVWDFYKALDQKSPIYQQHLLRATIRLNADNTRHFA